MVNFLGELCGYVSFASSNSFMYYCIFCENCFKSCKEFQNHSLKEHFGVNFIVKGNDNDFKNIAISDSNCEEIKSENYTNYEHDIIENEFCEDTLEFVENIDEKEEKNNFSDKENYSVSVKNDSIISNNLISFEEEENNEKYDIDLADRSELNNSPENLELKNVPNIFPFTLEDLDEKNLRCKYCNKQFKSKVHLIQHTKDHLNYVLTCKICGKHTSRKSHAQSHKKTHSKLRCDLCNVSFSSQKTLENHTKRHEILKCKYCQKVFKNQYYIQNHLRTHTGEKPYKCDVCSAAFALKRNLQSHVITQHTGDIKNFACKYCERKFKTKQLLDWHTKRIHLKEKPHQCEFCGLNFANMSGLRRHKLKLHTEYNKRPHHCKLCDKKFVELKNLTEHMNTHTGEKPFQCHICLKGFGQQSTLREHKKLHTGKKMHICKICGKAFAQQSGCANHMKQHNMCNISRVEIKPGDLNQRYYPRSK